MDPAQFLKGRTRETDIRRDGAGRWYNGDDPISHPNLVRSFDSWVDRAEDGRFCLSNSINWAYIRIEGPAYFVKDARAADDGIELVLSGGNEERLDSTTLCQDAEGALWCTVREGRCPARFDNHAVTKLADSVGSDEDGVFLQVGAEKVRPPEVSDPLSLGLEKS